MSNRKIENQSETLQKRFTGISMAIRDAKWRLQLVDLHYISMNSIRVSPADLKVLLTSQMCFMYKILGQFPDMVAIALIRADLTTAKRIIEVNLATMNVEFNHFLFVF